VALSSSGSISFSQLQAEYGGSHPISLSEYYQGSLGGANTTSLATTPNVGSNLNYSSVDNKITGTTRTWRRHNGFVHTGALVNASLYPQVGDQSLTLSYIDGADFSGNAGTIPTSGAVGLNHYRGTAKGTTSTLTCYGIIIQGYRTDLVNDAGTSTTNNYAYIYFYFAGHIGTNNQTSGSWDGFPFTTITCAAEGSATQFPATTFTFSGTHSANGAANSKVGKTHLNNSTLGNYTRCQFNTNGVGGNYHNFSGTWSITFSGF
tara:strand:- start:1501 stop:2286 length:786 start_codon:yes stop_codon:yes gene_type:complete